MTDLRQSPQYAEYINSIGWKIERINGCYIYIRKIPLIPFSIIKVQRPKKIPFEKIDQLAKKYRVFAIYLEPLQQFRVKDTSEMKPELGRSPRKRRKKEILIRPGYRLNKSPFLPTKTIQIDLTQPEEKILAQMKKDARYGIKKTKKEDIRILGGEDIRRFHQAWKKSVGWHRWLPSLKSLKALKKAFGQKAIFLTAVTHHTTLYDILAGTVILVAGKTAYYYYAFTSKEGRKKFAQYLLVWEAIKLAKKQGCKIFDFEGIYDERFPIKSWKGFSHFKKSFGGKEVEFIGCLSRWNLGAVFRRKSE